MARKSFLISVIAWIMIVFGSLPTGLSMSLHRDSESWIRTNSKAIFRWPETLRMRNAEPGTAFVSVAGTTHPNPAHDTPSRKGNPDDGITFKIVGIVCILILLVVGLLMIRCMVKARRKQAGLEAENRELRATNQAKDRLFNIIAHDLKTPAANIKSLAEILKENFADLPPEDRQNCIDMLLESAKTHNNMLNTLLDLSRVRTGSIPYTPERLDMRVLTDEVLEQTKLQAQQKQIAQTNCAEECFAMADKNMITTVIRNIVVNALKFTHPAGKVVVRARYDADKVLVSVADTGVGIDKETAEHLFDANYVKSTGGTFNEPGTGLGLTLCKEFVERHNGTIWLESTAGAGTTFFFTLPHAS